MLISVNAIAFTPQTTACCIKIQQRNGAVAQGMKGMTVEVHGDYNLRFKISDLLLGLKVAPAHRITASKP